MNPITYLIDHLMIPFLNFSYHSIYPNFGIAIILLTILVKVLLYPLTKQQFNSMKQMQAMMPTLKKLKEKHKDDPKKVQEETMKIYKEHKINPLGGCLPLVFQFPFLIALFYALNGTAFTELISHGSVFPGLTSFWLSDLSQKDPLYILPVIIGLSTYFGQKMSTADPSQQKILMFMPVLMVVISINMPGGVLLYWAFSQVISSGQQYIIMNQSKEQTT
jgi:YidC/Oxa1 family membrane protein insertase